jgi:hypothetical protein
VLDRVTHTIAEGGKDLVNFYQKGTFGLPGLIGGSFQSQAATSREEQFLI